MEPSPRSDRCERSLGSPRQPGVPRVRSARRARPPARAGAHGYLDLEFDKGSVETIGMTPIEKNPTLTPQPTIEEEPIEQSLRPQTLDEFVGQDRLKKNLRVFIEAARQRKEPLDHSLFYSPPGLGKTTLAGIIAHEMGVGLRITSGPVLERKGDLAAILTSLGEGDVLFIDEIHRLNHVVEETLYSVMEDFKLDIIIGEGPSAKTINLPVPRFTLVGATTRAGLLTSPLRDRFGITAHLEFYSEDELMTILERSTRILKIDVDEEGFHEIGRRSRGTPRIANRLLRRLRDFADVSEGRK